MEGPWNLPYWITGVSGQFPNLPLCLQRAPHQGAAQASMSEVFGCLVVPRVRAQPHTRAPNGPCTAPAGITVSPHPPHPPQWTRQAPQPCAPTSQTLMLSSASLVALPHSPNPSCKNKNKNKKPRGSINKRSIRPKRPGGSVAGRPAPERLASGPSMNPSGLLPSFLATAPGGAARVTHAARRLSGVTGPSVRRPQLKSRARN